MPKTLALLPNHYLYFYFTQSVLYQYFFLHIWDIFHKSKGDYNLICGPGGVILCNYPLDWLLAFKRVWNSLLSLVYIFSNSLSPYTSCFFYIEYSSLILGVFERTLYPLHSQPACPHPLVIYQGSSKYTKEIINRIIYPGKVISGSSPLLRTRLFATRTNSLHYPPQ